MIEAALTLYELNYLVAETIELTMNRTYWVKAEISDLRVRNGHCYMDLVEKDAKRNTPIAHARACCWRNVWSMLSPYFQRSTGESLHNGMNVLLEVYPQFHPQYGFTWIVENINPEYSLGDMMRHRQAIVEQLKKEGVFTLNKELHLPLFCQRLAVISSETAAGYEDFCKHIDTNEKHYRFSITLFPAVMQGESIETSIIDALDRIYTKSSDYDAVVIIRGGGATSDLSGFDSLLLAENVANFPLPIITGIGHERDECVLDMVSHVRVKTPTAAAAFFIDRLDHVWQILQEAQRRIDQTATQYLRYEHNRLDKIAYQLAPLCAKVQLTERLRLKNISSKISEMAIRYLNIKSGQINKLDEQIRSRCKACIQSQHLLLDTMSHKLDLLDPQKVLNRGYSYTVSDGKVVRDSKDVLNGSELVTHVQHGQITSVVIEPLNRKDK